MQRPATLTLVSSSSVGSCAELCAEYVIQIRKLYAMHIERANFRRVGEDEEVQQDGDDADGDSPCVRVVDSKLGRPVKIRRYRGSEGELLDTRMTIHVVITAKKMPSLGEVESSDLPWSRDVDMVRYLSRLAFFQSPHLSFASSAPLLDSVDLKFDFNDEEERVRVLVADFEGATAPGLAQPVVAYEVSVPNWANAILGRSADMPAILHITGGNTFYLDEVLRRASLIERVKDAFALWCEADDRFCVGQSAGGIFLANGNPLAAFAKGLLSKEAADLLVIRQKKGSTGNVLECALSVGRQDVSWGEMEEKLLLISDTACCGAPANPWCEALSELLKRGDSVWSQLTKEKACKNDAYSTVYRNGTCAYVNLPKAFATLGGDIVSFLAHKIVTGTADALMGAGELIFSQEAFLEVMENSIVVPHLELGVMTHAKKFCEKLIGLKEVEGSCVPCFLLEEGGGYVQVVVEHEGASYSSLNVSGRFTLFQKATQTIFGGDPRPRPPPVLVPQAQKNSQAADGEGGMVPHPASRIAPPARRIPHPASRIPLPASRTPHPRVRPSEISPSDIKDLSLLDVPIGRSLRDATARLAVGSAAEETNVAQQTRKSLSDFQKRDMKSASRRYEATTEMKKKAKADAQERAGRAHLAIELVRPITERRAFGERGGGGGVAASSRTSGAGGGGGGVAAGSRTSGRARR